ncbi:hypothetical protein H5410_026818 [Solanum commersonii]|uniref:PPM-type phosphatase domain-containing protein n=1 Tax=Solanum commersonii TaxID=4109 RepID=A0A9J5Z2M5_SOLCO|nr:hypothetical protein H5410_026818 [Solanum commersonii]
MSKYDYLLARIKHYSSTFLFTKPYVASKPEITFVKNNLDYKCLILVNDDFHVSIFKPEITFVKRKLDDGFFILQSDRLWNVVSSETTCSVARVCLQGDASFFLLSESTTTLCS